MTYLLHMQNLLSDTAIEDGALGHIGCNLPAIDNISTNISRGINQLTKMVLAIFHGNEANQMCPGRHFGNSSSVLKLQDSQ